MMKKSINLPRKLSAAICALLLLIGSVYLPLLLTAKAVDSPEVLTFENYPYNTTERAKFGIYTLFLKEGDGIGYDDNYALNFYFDGDSTFDRNGVETKQSSRWNQLDHVAKIGTVESGKTYAVTYYRKTNAGTNSNYTITICTGAETSIWHAGFVKLTETVVTATAAESDWVKETVIFTPNITVSNANTLYILFNSTEKNDYNLIDVYVDNVTIQSAENYICFNENGATNKTEYVFGNVGDEFTLPTMENGDNVFDGWYTDKECTVPFTATTIPAGVTNVFAKWKAGPMTFKNYPFDTSVTHIFGTTYRIANGDRIGINDDYALQMRFIGDEIYKTNDDGSIVYIYKRANELTNVAKLGTVEQGKIYRITYYYKVNSSNASVKVLPVTGNGNNIWASDFCNMNYDSSAYTIPAEENGEWTKAEVYMTADLKTSGNSIGNALFLRYIVNSASMDTKIDILVDNLYVEELSGNVVYFHSNSTDNDIAIDGEAGAPLTAPSVTNGKAEFSGWYTDKECTVPFTSTTIPEGVTHVYAKWGVSPMTFENYPYNTSSTGIFGATYKIKEGKDVGLGDNFALNMYFDGDQVYRIADNGDITYVYSRANQLTNIAKLGTVIDGQLYKVTFYYKVDSSNADITVVPVTGNGNNIWDSTVINQNYTASSVVIPKDKNGEWTKAEFYFTPSIKTTEKTTGDALFLYYTVSGANMDTLVDILIDDLLITEVDPPYIFFNSTKAGTSYFLKGEVGAEIKYPATPEAFGCTFTGWFTDEECTVPFKEKTFTEDMAVTVYAGWKTASEITYNFENYAIPYKGETKLNLRQDGYIKSTSKAYSGKNVLEFDRTGEFNAGSSYAAVAYDDQLFYVNKNNKYIVNVQFCVAKEITEKASLFVATGDRTNYWAHTVSSDPYQINTTLEVGKWYNASFVVDGSKIPQNTADALFVKLTGGKGGIIYVDDVTISTVPTGYTAVMINNDGCKNVPSLLIGKPGQSYASKLPTNPVFGNKYFKGYYTIDAGGSYVEKKAEDMKFTNEAETLYARFIDKVITQEFDDGDYITASTDGPVYGNYDFDYEVYDATLEGNSKDNVTSGNFSLHRKGTSPYKENALLLTINNKIAEGERYTVTFKVKMGQHTHTDGAVKVVSARSHRYAWTTTGEYYSVVPIADLTDGQWHEVSYTFNSVEPYVSIQTPGNAEFFIDDVVFELTPDAQLSTPLTYTEYVAGAKDDAGEIEIASIIDVSLYTQQGPSLLLIIGIAAAAIIILGAVAVIIIKAKKKSKI